jgi:hypothetical protein
VKNLLGSLFVVLSLFASFTVWAASIDEVTFLTKVQSYQSVNDTTLVTQEGKRLPIKKGTVLHVAGFTRNEALVISRKDKPNGFIKKTDIAPAKGK